MATQEREDAPASTRPSKSSSSEGVTKMNESSSDLDRVRDILFGERARDQDRRLEALRDELVLQLQEHRESAQKRMDDMEERWRTEMSDLKQKIQADSALKDEEQAQQGATLSAEIAALSARMENGLRDLKSESDASLLDLAKRLDKENHELRTELGARSAELSENKADRTVLSELLTDLASRLNDRPAGDSTGGEASER